MASVFLTRLRKTLSLTLRLTWSRRRTLVAGCVGGRRDVGGLSRALADSNCPTKLQLFITRPPPLLPRQFCPQALHFQRQRPGGLSADARMLRPRTCKQYKISLVPIHFRCCPTRDRFTGPVQDLSEQKGTLRGVTTDAKLVPIGSIWDTVASKAKMAGRRRFQILRFPARGDSGKAVGGRSCDWAHTILPTVESEEFEQRLPRWHDILRKENGCRGSPF